MQAHSCGCFNPILDKETALLTTVKDESAKDESLPAGAAGASSYNLNPAVLTITLRWSTLQC